MIIDCISDLHGFQPDLPGGDLLIVAGDLTARDEPDQHYFFQDWLTSLDYKHKVLIAGNHDGFFISSPPKVAGVHYLMDDIVDIEGYKIWGSPWTPEFCNWHFMKPRAMMKEVCDLIPDNTDIFVTHGPPWGICDTINKYPSSKLDRLGCWHLREALDRIKPKLHVFGHIHGGYGKHLHEETSTICVNAAIMDESYRPVNKPIRVQL